jgi:hypothetical protein
MERRKGGASLEKETIQRARQANLAEYLLRVGVPLAKSGNRYRQEHDSLVFAGNAYFWNSRGEHGNAIDYLTRHMNFSFVSAVSALAGGSVGEYVPNHLPTEKKNFEFFQANFNKSYDKVTSHLRKVRCISKDLISLLIEEKLLFQESHSNNAFFPMYDENGHCVGGERQGTTPKRFKGISAGSKSGYGFNVKFSSNDTFDYALFFESAIDLISFIDYKQTYEGKDLDKCILISMAGLKLNTIKHTLKAFKDNLGVVLCVDNDPAGHSFKNEINQANITYIDRSPHNDFKDWNEQLINKVQSMKPIARLMDYSKNNNPVL